MAPSTTTTSSLNLSLSLRSKLPAVFYKIPLDRLEGLLRKLTLSAILHALPKIGKFLICLLFLLNIRSWPTLWHFHVFSPVFKIRFSYACMRLLAILTFKSRTQRIQMEDRWLDNFTPVGQDPFGVLVKSKGWVGPDDSDFNGHMSNSSYAKILDTARFKAAIAMFPRFLAVGGWTPLAGTHYSFIREIPMLASYEIHSSIAAWDQKWLYVLSKFVSKSKPKHKSKSTSRSKEEGKEHASNNGFSGGLMPLRTPGAEGISSTGTPYTINTPPHAAAEANGKSHSTRDTEKALNAVLSGLSSSPSQPSSSPETLHTVVVSQICYKIGRITVPPALVLAVNGLTGAPGHSLENPHPGWEEAKRIMSRMKGGSGEELAGFLGGGWRAVSEEERWWDRALGPEVEERRVRNLRIVDELRVGLEGARDL